jgi:hypothetical protein
MRQGRKTVMIQHPTSINYVQKVVKSEGVSVATKVLFMSFFSLFLPTKQKPNRSKYTNLQKGQALDGSHAPSRLGPHTSAVLLAELNTAVCAAANSDEEAETPDAGDDHTDRGDLADGLAGDDEWRGRLNGSRSGGCGLRVNVGWARGRFGEDAVDEGCVA